jgi:predicted 3-demethylubiquinone-9 3-methyltransferase (glyoxalase superfamily)
MSIQGFRGRPVVSPVTLGRMHKPGDNAMPNIQRIAPCLWFDDQAEEAAEHYTSIFKNSRIVRTICYGEAGQEIHGRAPGTVMTVDFELDGQAFNALNGGPLFKFNEAVSLQVNCETQDEVDYYWEKLSEGGDENAQQCGWLKDKYGLSWQVVPTLLADLVSDPESEKSQRAMNAMLRMKKLDIAELQRAYEGQG